MNIDTTIQLNSFINKAYECEAFSDFLKHAIMNLHKFVMYDSGMFYCSISHDCSYFKPYLTGDINLYYKKEQFSERNKYLDYGNSDLIENQTNVFKSHELKNGQFKFITLIEPRKFFLEEQKQYHIVCIRVIYKDQFLGEIYLHREKANSDFSDEDMLILNLLQPHISTVFNLIHKKTASLYIEKNNQSKNNIGMCAFDKELAIVSTNIIGLDMLKAITIYGSSMLHHVKELCQPFDIEDKFESKKIDTIKIKDSEIIVDVFYYPPKVGGQVSYIVMMQYTSENLMVSDYKFKFTKREADIIDALVQGKNNSQIAGGLCLSENTVKTHIKNIYAKTGANNRTELTYLLMLNK